MIASSLRAILDTAVDGIILMDARGKVTMFNSACERIFGYAAEEIVGGDVKRLMPNPYHDEHDQYLLNYQHSRERKIIGIGRQVVGRRKSGDTFPMDLSVGEATNDLGVFYVGILRDVSDRVRAEEQRERLVEHLAKSNEEQTHFVHAASHDLREPLRMISAFCGRLARDYSDRLDPRGAEYLSLAVAASEHMKRLLDDLVEFARLSDDTERSSRFDANSVVDQVVDGLSKVIQRSDAEITHGALPHITVNPIRFERLMQNLDRQRAQICRGGCAPLHPRRRGARGRLLAVFRRRQRHRHRPASLRANFPTVQAAACAGRYEGVGLGLAICRKIVEGFGGAISVRSSEGQGSTFSFTIPTDKHPGEDENHDA